MKKPTDQQETEDPGDFTDKNPTTVMCPNHQLPLQVQTENREVGGKTMFVRFAICNCAVEDNRSLGQRVWEQT